MTPSDIHNRVAPEVVARILYAAPDRNGALVLLESVVLGVIMHAALKDVRIAEAFLDTMALRVTERLTTWPKS